MGLPVGSSPATAAVAIAEKNGKGDSSAAGIRTSICQPPAPGFRASQDRARPAGQPFGGKRPGGFSRQAREIGPGHAHNRRRRDAVADATARRGLISLGIRHPPASGKGPAAVFARHRSNSRNVQPVVWRIDDVVWEIKMLKAALIRFSTFVGLDREHAGGALPSMVLTQRFSSSRRRDRGGGDENSRLRWGE